MHPDTVLGAIAAGATAVSLWPLYLTVVAPVPVLLAPLVAQVCGMLAGYVVIVLIALMSRWPALERSVGCYRLARWHSRGVPIVLALVLVHGSAAAIAWADARGENLLTAVVEVLGMPGLLAATMGTALMVAVAVVSAGRHDNDSASRSGTASTSTCTSPSRSPSPTSSPDPISSGTVRCRCSGR